MDIKKKFILFDFDGVIADSFAPAYETIKLIYTGLTEEDYRKGFEGNINDWNGPLYSECRKDIDFFSEYIPRFKECATIMPDVPQAIAELANKYTLIVISSTTTGPIKDFMEKYKLSGHFTEIMGNDIHESKVEKIKMVFDKYKIGPAESIFITDTLGDIKEAEKMGVKSIGVSWGFQSKDTLLKGNPLCIVEKPENLALAVQEFFL